MAWNASLPTDDGLLINFPAECQANWEAIVLGTDLSLLITDSKISNSAAIEESKILFSGTGHGHTGGTDGKLVTSAFITGDWLLSSVSTAHTGWTNVSATYSDKFMRINTTPLSTGGSNTHQHTLIEDNIPSHSHGATGLSVDSDGAHVHAIPIHRDPGTQSMLCEWESTLNRTLDQGSESGSHTHTATGNTSSTGSGTATTSVNHIPSYFQTVVFQKD